jgi:hypothetical protein
MVHEPDNNAIAYYRFDNLGSQVAINTTKFESLVERIGPVAADGVLAHELTHAAQNFLKRPYEVDKPYEARAAEQNAFRRESKTRGFPAISPDKIPETNRETVRTGAEDWRLKPQHYVYRGAPDTPIKRYPNADLGRFDIEYTNRGKNSMYRVYQTGSNKVIKEFKYEQQAKQWLRENESKLLLKYPPDGGF